MGTGSSTPMTTPLGSSMPTSVNPNQATINQKLIDAQTNVANGQLAAAKVLLNDAIALGALKTDENVINVINNLRTRGVFVGGKRRKSKRSSKPKRKSRRKQRN